MGVRCFFVQPNGMVRRALRRYVWSHAAKCPGPSGYHDASVPLDTVAEFEGVSSLDQVPRDDPRWPTKCAACDYVFTADDEWQIFINHEYVDVNGGLHTLRDNTPGMMWDAPWYPARWKGTDGRSLVVVCPDGHAWPIDSVATNCTKPDDHVHRCWIRHGEPPNITVDKNGNTCAAGAGSIQTPGYHGHLINGEFQP